jgi:methionyl-tRNA formyltransferase
MVKAAGEREVGDSGHVTVRILFWGSPDFALRSLRAVADRYELAGVVTQPDRPAGRGRHLRESAVKRAAIELGAPILQPENARSEEFLESISELRPDLSVVAAYGQLLVDEVLALPALGSINVHASLLPELRGAAPINWAIIRGHDLTGVTIMRMVREMDAGPILHQATEPIGSDTTAGELSDRLSALGAEALSKTLYRLEAGDVAEQEQDHGRATFAPKMSRELARIDWSLPASEIGCWMRGCDPWPAAWTELDGSVVQLFKPSLPALETVRGPAAAPGTVVEADPREGLIVATGSGTIQVGEVKPAGRARMEAAAWIRGRGAASGDRFL